MSGFGQYCTQENAGRRYTLREAEGFIIPNEKEREVNQGRVKRLSDANIRVKRFGHNRFMAFHDDGSIAYYLHRSAIVYFDAIKKTLRVDLCGWPTTTTRQAIMQFAAPYGLKFCWAGRKGDTCIGWRDQGELVFQNNITLSVAS